MWKRSNGQNVSDFCRETGTCYSSVWNYIVNKKLSVDDACAMALKRKGYKNGRAKYFVGDITLRQYCRENKINYQRIYYHAKRGENWRELLDG